ncbi:TIGR03617 family F420-dependent LLM class oxidoreductase [Frankia sp. CNm7]|uniref:TIGR03617 family F420-dependent LLM class oxidoreductase n=1 Tax=Frankia nepalensis TaxID=1836974 RepID=A0A937UVV8_9ACTN|nr:TIGR03617 family F420-dependent LLM class oxidoreductase [Frankia nepalensis]MBL7501883.1 TIGR03617 family F420-dependent LLM class oxidoreductase [Frankia nepalensis]MBL7511623.1 TIGR03617 family F420-dependent LLM class oxidoreductase [Frankia nepalensis]MBL7523670.1 TIGR03617 family F420-dependent LLM class oxidoreductase [Frankia nepalensis]MBL7633615.1 TIGR03617 family F420-dependent LLM class oxidoreductase [Frankia nepalensis]
MKIDASLSDDIGATQAAAAKIESDGYAGAWTSETKHDPFLQSLQAAMATESISVGTAIAIGFARTPMTLANLGYDLARYSKGRFILGLGSQIKPHIERRFSMPWSHPAPRMRELILATRAIWATWHEGEKLNFRGDFYNHTLMTPFFTPEAHEYGPPPVYLAAVGEKMTEVAGEVADGFFVHPFTTMRYLEEVTIPALLRGRAKAGKEGLDGFVINGPSFVTVGRTQEELAANIRGTKARIAFYGSTPAYRQVLEIHGWGEAQDELNALSKQGRWDDMADVITDEMLNEFSIVGTPAEVGPRLVAKVGKTYERITFYGGYEAEPALWAELLAATR